MKITIEGFSCGEIMSFEVTENGNIINLNNCNLADIGINNTIRIQSNEPIIEDGKTDF